MDDLHSIGDVFSRWHGRLESSLARLESGLLRRGDDGLRLIGISAFVASAVHCSSYVVVHLTGLDAVIRECGSHY